MPDDKFPSPAKAAKEVLDLILSTPHGRELAKKFEDKDNALTEFQKANDITDADAEVALKEWVHTHEGQNFDWNLEEVKTICLRNKQSGIPHAYLPEAVKKQRTSGEAGTAANG